MAEPNQVSRLLLECGNTLGSRRTTGIQRVVRKLVEAASLHESNIAPTCRPVVISRGQLYFARSAVAHRRCHKVYRLVKQAVGERCASSTLPRFCRIFGYGPSERVEVDAGDIILLIDASWVEPGWDELRRAKQRGAIVGGLCHDMIPITAPGYFPEKLPIEFKAWFDRAVCEFDFFLASTKTVRDEIEAYSCNRRREGSLPLLVDHFAFGQDFAKPAAKPIVRPALRKFLSNENEVKFLAVGTVEPRKNYDKLLDAWLQAQQDGATSKLAIVGGAGWKCKATIDRIIQLANSNSQLLHLSDATDDELHFAYANCDTLVNTSLAEGFGLPLIEANHFGLDVIANDIPVFREVAGSFATFFDGSATGLKAQMIDRVERRRKGGVSTSSHALHTMSWSDSFRQLESKCQSLFERILSAKASSEHLRSKTDARRL